MCEPHLLDYEGWLHGHARTVSMFKGPHTWLNAMLPPTDILEILRVFKQVALHFHFSVGVLQVRSYILRALEPYKA